MSDFGLRFFLAKGAGDRRLYVLDVIADDGSLRVLWTEDLSLAHRFEHRAEAEMTRDAIMLAEQRSAVALMPEA